MNQPLMPSNLQLAAPAASPAPLAAPAASPVAPVAPAPVPTPTVEDDTIQPDGTHAGHTERRHAKVSSSVLHRLYHCLYSVMPGLELPPEVESEAAKLGTGVHEILELRLNDFLNHKEHGTSPAASMEKIQAHEYYSLDTLAVVDGCVKAIWEKGFHESITNKFWQTETRFVLVQDPEVSGIPDLWMACINDKGEKEGYIFDYKNGVNDVEIKNNKQLLFLAVCMQEIMGAKRPFDRIRTAIYQPHSMAGGDAYKESSYTAKQIAAGRSKILQIAKKVYQPEKDKKGNLKGFKPKEGPGCKWCPALTICPEKKRQLREIAVMSPASTDITIPDINSLDDETLVKILTHDKQISDFLSAVRQMATERAVAGNPLPGFKVVKGTSRRQWKKNTEEIISALETLGVAQPWEKKLRTLTAIEKEIGKDQLEQFVQRTEPKPILTTEDDKRAPYLETRREDLVAIASGSITPPESRDQPLSEVADSVLGSPEDVSGVEVQSPEAEPEEKPKPKSKAKAKKRGRPKGSKNKTTKAKAAPKAKAKRKRRTTRKTKKKE